MDLDFVRGMRQQHAMLENIKGIVVGLERKSRPSRAERDPEPSRAALLLRSLALRVRALGVDAEANALDFAERFYDVTIEKMPTRLASAIARPENIFKAAVNPASTLVAGWAAELVGTVANVASPLAALSATSAYAQLSVRGPRINIQGTGGSQVRLPSRTSNALVGGAFLAELGAIKVGRIALTSALIQPYKIGIISTFSEEIRELSIPDIEQVLRQAIAEDIQGTIDTAMLDANVAGPTRPAGLLNGVTPLTATAITNGPLAALSGDVGQLAAAVSKPVDFVVLMNTAERLRAITLAPALSGAILEAPTLPAKQIVGIDANDFVSAESEEPRFTISTESSIHEDDAPTALSAVGSPNTVAAPMRSLFQTDCVALRGISFVDWILRRPNRIATITGVTW